MAAEDPPKDEAAAMEVDEKEVQGEAHAEEGEQKEDPKEDAKAESKEAAKEDTKEESKDEKKEESKEATKEESKQDATEESKEDAVKAAEAKAEEADKELEEDAAEDQRAKVDASSVAWSTSDSTMNVMQVAGGSIMMSVTEGGFQYLLAGARSNAGLKAGRYLFELKIVEALHPIEPPSSQAHSPAPRNLVRVGLSLAQSSLLLADSEDSVCFDSEGFFVHGRKRNKVSKKFGRDETVGLLINLDPNSSNAHTVSLFRDGCRISTPQKLPENLQGKVLYPSIAYKNVTLNVNLGPECQCALPFTCRMVGEAAAADVELTTQASKDVPREVVFPIGLPDTGLFDFVDAFLEQHPDHIELSDRKILEWAAKSGIRRSSKGFSKAHCNDRPDFNTGLALMDDLSVRRVMFALAPALKRDYVVLQLKNNLIAEERKRALQRFSGKAYKRVAMVLMGEPSDEYKKRVQDLTLAEKTAEAEVQKRRKAADEERQRLLLERKKKAEEAKKLREKKQNGNEEKAEEKKDEAMGVEEKEGEEAKVEEDVAIELTSEEKALWCRKSEFPDVSERSLGRAYANFSIPTADEGFDEIKFVWQSKDKCELHFRDWLLNRKRTQLIEDIQPSEWFTGEYNSWRKVLQEWKRKQNEFRDPVKRKFNQKKREEELKKKQKEDGVDGEAVQPEPADVNIDDEAIADVEDVMDIGGGKPLFSEFVYEDWTLLSTRFELHLLVHAFRKDVNDPDRPSFREDQLAFYYEKYFKKPFVLKNFGVEAFADFLEMLEDSIGMVEGSSFLEAKLPLETPPAKFMKMAEEHRRDRARRVDAGDETAQLKFKRPAPPPTSQPARPPPARGSAAQRLPAPAYGGGHRDAPRVSSSRDTRGSSGGQGGSDYGQNHGGGRSSYDSQKRTYESSYPPSKSSRTTYSGSGGRGDDKGSGGGGYKRSEYSGSGGYRR